MPASVRNISAHGMMLRMPAPPVAGTYVEVEAGAIAVAARIVWALGQSCGLRSRDRFDLSSLNAGRGRPTIQMAAIPARTHQTRPVHRDDAERSRQISSLIQYLTFAALAVAAAGSLAYEVHQVLRAPFAAVEQKLGGQ